MAVNKCILPVLTCVQNVTLNRCSCTFEAQGSSCKLCCSQAHCSQHLKWHNNMLAIMSLGDSYSGGIWLIGVVFLGNEQKQYTVPQLDAIQ